MKSLLAVLACLVAGFFLVAIPTASSALSGPKTSPVALALHPAALEDARAAARADAQAACDVLLSYGRVIECKIIEWNPSIDFTINATRDEAIAICGRAVKILAGKVPQVVGKGWTLRTLPSATVPPNAACGLI